MGLDPSPPPLYQADIQPDTHEVKDMRTVINTQTVMNMQTDKQTGIDILTVINTQTAINIQTDKHTDSKSLWGGYD